MVSELFSAYFTQFNVNSCVFSFQVREDGSRVDNSRIVLSLLPRTPTTTPLLGQFEARVATFLV